MLYAGLLGAFFWIGFLSAEFQTLDQAVRYTQQVEEFPEANNDDLEHPDFTDYYVRLKPRWWQSIARRLHIKAAPLWEPEQFLKTLKELRKHPLPTTGKPVVERTCASGDKILVLGDIHGNFHSLVRSLVYWHKAGIIDKSFKIIDPHIFIVSMGNAIDFSAYSLETLSLLIELIRVNEGRFYYLRGAHEDKRTWQDFSLYDELKYRFPASTLLRDSVAQLDGFFESLPTTFIVNLQGTHERLVFVGSSDEIPSAQALVKGNQAIKKGEEDLGLRMIGGFQGQRAYWSTVSAPIRLYRMHNNFFYDSYVEIVLKEALARSTISLYFNQGEVYKKGPTYNLVTGFLQERGAAPRHIRSPEIKNLDQAALENRVNFLSRELNELTITLDFLRKQLPQNTAQAEESEVILKGKEALDKSGQGDPGVLQQFTRLERTYNRLEQDIEDLQGLAIKRGLTLKLPLDKRHEQGKEKPLVIGSTLDLSKSVKGLGIPFKTGISLKVNEQNEKGGVQGRRIQMIFMDDGYIPSISRRNIEKIIYEYHTPFVLAPIGTPTLLASMEIIKSKKVVILFPQSGSLAFRKPELSNIVNFRASFDDEGRLLTDYVLKRHLPKNFGFFYQDDAFGISILNGAKRTLKKEGVAAGVEVSYLANTTLFHEAAQKLKNANPDAIGFFATGPATLQLIRDIGVEFLANKTLYAVSSAGDEATVKVLKEKGLTMIFGQVVPNPVTSDIEIVKEYRQQAKANGQRPNVFSLEAYIVTSITLDLMNTLKGEITPDKLLKKVESLKEYNFKGLTLNFNAENRSLAHDFWIDTGEGEWVKKKIKEE